MYECDYCKCQFSYENEDVKYEDVGYSFLKILQVSIRILNLILMIVVMNLLIGESVQM